MIFLRILSAAVLGFAVATAAAAADDPVPPRVGRIAAVVGGVDFAPSGGDWSLALVNEPVVAGTGLRSDAAGRGALALAGDRVTLAPAGELRITTLTADWLQVELKRGRIGVHLDGGEAGRTVEIDLPQGGVWLAAPGDYDIAAAAEHAPARIAVFAGSATVAGAAGPTEIAAGALAMLHGDAPAEVTAAAAVPDEFTEWWRRADADAATAASHLPAGIAGAAELERSGEWQSDPTYGEVWYPSGLLADWMPFRDGRWRWINPGGWTWIDDAAWGFAPAHYGAWVRIDERWAWAPGPSDQGPAYMAARVAFLGTPAVGLSYPGEGAAIGWFALAPGEDAAATPDDDFRNRRFASVVLRASFTGGKPVPPNLIALPTVRLADAPVITAGELALTPPQPRRPAPAAIAAVPRVRPAAAAVRRQVIVRVAAASRPGVVKPVVFKPAAHRPLPRARFTASTRPPVPPHNRRHLATNGVAIP